MTTQFNRQQQLNAAERRVRVAQLYLQGKTQMDIAATEGVSKATITYDLKAIQKAWIAAAVMDLNEAKARELSKIDNLERTYWEAWERSQEDAEVITQEQQGEKAAKARVQRTGQVGDPRFLQGVQWCIERRAKLLGLDAPARMDMTGSIQISEAKRVLDAVYGSDSAEPIPG